MQLNHRPLLLLILDGWGYREDPDHNAIAAANTPVWDKLWQNCPHTLVDASAEAVGLPRGQMGNSEVGHTHMGAGRLLRQNLVRINHDIEQGQFQQNDVLIDAIEKAKQGNKAVHILGLLSPGGVHSHEQHIQAMAEMAVANGATEVYAHTFLDGRDTPPRSALASLKALDKKFEQLGTGRTASIIGRYYAMDRDKRWARTEAAYDMLTTGKADFYADTAERGLQMAYDRGENDEFVQSTLVGDPVMINDGDVIIFMNFRADRARQLTRAFTESDFHEFTRHHCPALAEFVSLTEYASDIHTNVAYPPLQPDEVFGQYIAEFGMRQLRIAETEKYAHVTFFFNGGTETPFPGEDRILIPSPKVPTYDLQPEMSAPELTDRLVDAISSNTYDVIICNYANPDMLGHTGNFDAAVKAIETIDECLSHITKALAKVGGEAIITADHGNVETMFNPETGQPHTAHTNNLVPVIYIGRPATPTTDTGVLFDIAPTLLNIMQLDPAPGMTGKSLFKLEAAK